MLKICVFSLKGGQGKSTISAEIALHFNAGVITNEPYTILEAILPPKSLLIVKEKEKIPLIAGAPIVYDFGGYVDSRVLEVAKISDFIIVPICADSDGDIQAGITTAVELKDHTEKIIFVCNKTDKDRISGVKEAINNFFPNNKFFIINKSKALSNLRHNKKSINEIVLESKFNAYCYRNVAKQINDLFTYIKA